MDGFMNWFFAFMTTMLRAVWGSISGFFGGIIQIFNFPLYFEQINRFKGDFNFMGWVLAILTFIIAYAIWFAIIFIIIIFIRKYLRFRKSIVGNEDLLEEIADLHRDVLRLTNEKEKILAMKFEPSGLSYEDLKTIFEDEKEKNAAVLPQAKETAPESGDTSGASAENESKRFFRLSAVDDKYKYRPQYVAFRAVRRYTQFCLHTFKALL